MKIFHARAEYCYSTWDAPDLIISDGAYGLQGRGGFDGDVRHSLSEWYAPHIEAWSRYSKPSTTLWFWNREIGWAEIHPKLCAAGWMYRSCCVWNKGISHVAGRTNTKTLRTFPVSTEICVHYVRDDLSVRTYLRNEWKRSGLPMSRANLACGVKNAATRKYLTDDHLWYMPPKREYDMMAAYLNEHGAKEGKPYLTEAWERLPSAASHFDCPMGKTNVWNEPPVRGKDRWKNAQNQKPDVLIEMLVQTSSAVSDVVWEPFGGTFSIVRACEKLGRNCFAAESDLGVYHEFRNRYGESSCPS